MTCANTQRTWSGLSSRRDCGRNRRGDGDRQKNTEIRRRGARTEKKIVARATRAGAPTGGARCRRRSCSPPPCSACSAGCRVRQRAGLFDFARRSSSSRTACSAGTTATAVTVKPGLILLRIQAAGVRLQDLRRPVGRVRLQADQGCSGLKSGTLHGRGWRAGRCCRRTCRPGRPDCSSIVMWRFASGVPFGCRT